MEKSTMKTIKKIFFSLVVFTFGFYSQSNAQDAGVLQYMELLPQFNYNNPANIPAYTFYIGFPGLSQFNTRINNSSFSYNNLFTRGIDDSLRFDKSKFLNAIDDKNIIGTNTNLQLFTLGFQARKTYINFSISQKLSANFRYTKNMMTFLLNGNAAFLGENVDLSDNKLEANAYTEIALGVSRQIGQKWTAGVRFKYLIGQMNVYTEKSDLKFYTDPTTYQLLVTSDMMIHTSSPLDSVQQIDEQMKNLNASDFTKNRGFAFDFGANYRLNNRWSFGASILDWGGINWEQNVKDYRSKRSNSTFSFEGFDINKVFGGEGMNDSIFNNLVDSLKNALGIEETEGKSYRSPLNTKIYLSACFDATARDRFGLVFRNEFIARKLNTQVTVSYNRTLGKNFGITLANTMINGKLLNMGGGFVVNLGPLQWHLIVDQISSFYAADLKNINFYFGFNFVGGKTGPRNLKKTDKPKEMPQLPYIPQVDTSKVQPVIPADSLFNTPVDSFNIKVSDSTQKNFIDSLFNQNSDSLRIFFNDSLAKSMFNDTLLNKAAEPIINPLLNNSNTDSTKVEAVPAVNDIQKYGDTQFGLPENVPQAPVSTTPPAKPKGTKTTNPKKKTTTVKPKKATPPVTPK